MRGPVNQRQPEGGAKVEGIMGRNNEQKREV